MEVTTYCCSICGEHFFSITMINQNNFWTSQWSRGIPILTWVHLLLPSELQQLLRGNSFCLKYFQCDSIGTPWTQVTGTYEWCLLLMLTDYINDSNVVWQAHEKIPEIVRLKRYWLIPTIVTGFYCSWVTRPAMAMDHSSGKEALMTAESITVHISSVYCVDVNFNFSLFIFRQERKTDEAWLI